MNKKIFFTFITTISTILLIFNPIAYSEDNQNEEKTFFKVDKINDRWFFIDPDGKPFFSVGIGSISATSGYSPELGYSEYYKNIMDLYGSEQNWANITHERIVDWGFNTLGGSGKYIRVKGLNYTINLGLANDDWITGEIVDYFSNEWINYVDKRCKDKIINVSNDTKLIGYFLDNEIKWGSDWRGLLDIFDTYMKLEYYEAGKIRLVDFLKVKYQNNISKFNIAWRENFLDFDEILYEKTLGTWPYTIDARNDHNDFLYIVAEQFYKVCYEKIKKYDSNHLILGSRFLSYFAPIKVLEASKEYVDVISVNHYTPNPLIIPFWFIFQDIIGFARPTNYLKEFNKITDKPILISEFYFRALDSGLPNTKPYRFFMTVQFTQKQRAICFELQTRPFIKKPYSVGYHWFGYCDQPKTGRFDGENSNNGLVNINDEPYEKLIKSIEQVNFIAQNSVKNIY